MPTHSIKRSKDMANAAQAWAYVCDFGSNWHPDIVSNQLETDAAGAVVRVFNDRDGNNYREQITYLSNTDRTLHYALTDGIADIKDYRGTVYVSANFVIWSATYNAEDKLGQAVAEGTRAIFDNGLNWLASNATTSNNKATPSIAKSHAPLHRIQLNNAPHLSILSANKPGSACAELVLFLHGIGGNATNWLSQLEALSQTHNVAALDFRGYGESALGNDQTHIDDHCDDILSVVSYFGASKLVVVGLSMGSWIATSFAMRHPNLLTGLVLAGGCTGMSEADADTRGQFLQSRAVPLSKGKTPAEFADDVVELISGPSATDEQRATLHASISAIGSKTYLDALTCFCNPIERFDFSRIACPVLMMTGEYDRLAPPDEIRNVSLRIHEAIYKADRLPDIRFEVLNDSGHLCNLEQPDSFNNHLVEFLERMPNTRLSKSANRESKRQIKSRRILDAALEEFSAQGYDGVSMASIATRAGVSKPTLYQYFGDKDHLFTTVLQEGCEHIITPLSAPDGSLVDRLWNFSWTYAEFVLRPDMLSLARLVLGEASRRPEVAGIYHDAGPGKAFKGLVMFIQECVSAEQLDVDDIEYAAQDLWSLILSGPRDYHLHFVNEKPDPADLLRSIDHGLQVFLKVYSTNLEADLTVLAMKVTSFEASSKK